jgi:hypothetical protein
MINQALIIVWFETLGLAATTMVICARLNRTWISAATAYWVGWLFVIGACAVSDYYSWNNRYATQAACDSILTLHISAAVGFTLGSLMAGRVERRLTVPAALQSVQRSQRVLELLSRNVLFTVFVLGCAFLTNSAAAAGGFSLRDVRSAYIDHDIGVIELVATHAYMLLCALAALRGTQDGIVGARIKWLGTLIVASAPLGLGNAGRIFLLQVLLIYSFPFMLSRSQAPQRSGSQKRHELRQLLALGLACVVAFALIGGLRNRSDGESRNPLMEVLAWPASSIDVLDSWISVAENFTPADGGVSFEWLARNLERFHLVDLSDVHNELAAATRRLGVEGDNAAYVPKTIIPELIMDFGRTAFPVAMAITAVILQFVSVRLRGRSPFATVVAAMALFGAFCSVQGGVLRPDVCLVVFWTLVLATLARKGKKRSVPGIVRVPIPHET